MPPSVPPATEDELEGVSVPPALAPAEAIPLEEGAFAVAAFHGLLWCTPPAPAEAIEARFAPDEEVEIVPPLGPPDEVNRCRSSLVVGLCGFDDGGDLSDRVRLLSMLAMKVQQYSVSRRIGCC